jgi:HD-GYP domain-containing protein (c-di-GMP phosphodiesterase class II)
MAVAGVTHVRMAELVAALSLGIDLGFGQPMEHVLRQTLIALRLAERMGLDREARAITYYTALLTNVGCHTDAHEQAKWFGDDIGLKADKYRYPLHGVRSTAAMMRHLGAGHPLVHRFRIGLEFVVAGHRDIDHMVAHHARMARTFAQQLRLPSGVVEAVGACYEQWDGHGWPGELAGEDIPVGARLAAIGEFTEVALRVGGVEAARRMAQQRSGTQFDPRLASEFDAGAADIRAELETVETWSAVINAEPALATALSDDEFDLALEAIADFVDLKSPFSLGHSRAVADLVADAAAQLGQSESEVSTLRRAGLVHDLGRLGVSNSIWDKPGKLGAGEWERVRMTPYLTERMLRQSEPLRQLGSIALQRGERLDGSGYPAGLSGGAVSHSARLLAAADAYRAMREPRPYRDPLPPERAAAELKADVRSGRLDGEAVETVLAAAGHPRRRRRVAPAGLTAREIEVLRLLARGLTNKDIAACLYVSPKTVSNHVEHIYTKLDVQTRTAAGLIATQLGLLTDDEPGRG